MRIKIAVGAALAASLTLAACGGGDGVKLKQQTLTFSEGAELDSNFIDNPPTTKRVNGPPASVSLGDMVVFRFGYVGASKQSIGSLDLACTITKAGSLADSSQQCTGTASLPGGTLAVITAGKGGPTNRGAVIGGTGKYDGASGSFMSERTSPTAGKDVFRVFLPRT